MKLKKFLASVTAAALAVTTMAVTSFTASADNEITFASINGVAAKSVVIDYSLSTDKENDWEYAYSAIDVIVKTWNNNASSGDWIQYGIGGSEQAQYYSDGNFVAYNGTAINDSLTVNLTEYDTLDELAILYKDEQDVYTFAINSVKAYSGASGAGDVVWQYPVSTTPPDDEEDGGDKPNPPATGKTHEGSATLVATEYEGWFTATPTLAELIGDLDPTKTIIVFSGENLTQIGYNSVKTTPNAEGSKWHQIENFALPYTFDASDILIDGYYFSLGGNAATVVTWVATEGGSQVGGEEEGGLYNINVEWNDLVVGQICEAYAEITYTEDGVTVDVANSDDNPEEFTWTIEDSSIATISPTGVITAVAPGATTFNVRYDDENIEDGYIDVTSTLTVTAASVTPEPSAPTYAPPASNPAPITSTTVVDTILAVPDGGNGSINLGSSTKLDRLAMDALSAKGDVTVKFTVAGGAYWEINGNNITEAKAVDLGVKVNSTLIPESKVNEFAGDKTTVQLTLRHNGDFGFTGTLNVPVGKANNGKFANLYYYHGGKFDFVGSSAISGGMTKFAFSHASNYLIVIDDYAYGEDVSSAAGMTETTTSAVPYAAAVVIIAAFGTSAIVLKKRLSK